MRISGEVIGKLGNLVLQLAGVLLPATATRPVGEVAVEDWRRVNLQRKTLFEGINEGLG